jgi:hypothetical protein
MRKLNSMLVLFACVAATGSYARAADKTGLLGGSVKLEYLYTDGAEITEYATLPKTDIGSHVEFADSRLHFANGGKPWRFCITMDITETNIRISDLYLLWNGQETHEGRLNPTTFNGLVLQFNNIRPITSVTINPETTLGAATAEEGTAFDQKRITFSKNQITINWANVKIDENSVLSLDVNAPATPAKAAAVLQEHRGPADKEPGSATR